MSTTPVLPPKAVASIPASKLVIEVDLTKVDGKESTRILLDGQPIPNLSSFSFNFWGGSGSCCPFSINFSTRDPEETEGQFCQSAYFSFVPRHDDSGGLVRAEAQDAFRRVTEVPEALRGLNYSRLADVRGYARTIGMK